MNAYEIIIGAILIVAALVVIAIILLQEGRQANVGVISGAAETFLDKGAAKTMEMRLAKITKIVAISFFVLVLVGMLVTKFLGADALSKDNSGSTTTTTTTAHNHDHDHDTTTTAGGTTTTTAGSTTTTTVADEK